MSFIASVIADKGFAIVSDSVEIPELPILGSQYSGLGSVMPSSFRQLDNLLVNPYYIEPDEMDNLPDAFLSSPFGRHEFGNLHEQDHVPRMQALDKFTVIAATGSIYINNKSFFELVAEFRDDWSIPLLNSWEERVDLDKFHHFILQEARHHTQQYGLLNKGIIQGIRYAPYSKTTASFRINIREKYPSENWYSYPDIHLHKSRRKVIWRGQSRICASITQALEKREGQCVPRIVKNIIKRIHTFDGNLPNRLLYALGHDPIYQHMLYDNLQDVSIDSLNINQAVDLASLLLKLETDLSRYLHPIPRVGGITSIAVVDDRGFQQIR